MPKYTKKHTNFLLIFGLLLLRLPPPLRTVACSARLLPLSRAWHTFCPDTIFVGLTAQECAENQKTNCGRVFREFWEGWKDEKHNVLIFNLLWRYFIKTSAIVALALSTRAAKLQYSCCEYWVEVALRVDESGTCTRREWHFGWAKVAFVHRKTTFLWFSRRTAMAKCHALFSRMEVSVEGHWTIFALQVTGMEQRFLLLISMERMNLPRIAP